MAKKDNWVKLYRSLMNHEIWLDEPFTRGQAWVDLIMMACFKETDNIYRGKLQHLGVGSIRTSIRYLAKRWNRSQKWVRKTLGTLKGMQMVHIEGSNQGTTITLENYASFQNQGRAKDITKDITEGITEGTHNKNVYKNVKRNARANEDQNGEALVAAPDGERYIEVRGADGKVFIYDTVEEEYVG